MRKLLTSITRLYLCLLILTATALADTAASELDSFIRYNKNPSQLETSVVTYKNAKGQTLDLISAVHVGSSSYYKTLNDRFKSYDALLYELIIPDEMAGQRMPSQMGSDSGVAGIQGMLARSLGLVTQIDKIDYSAENFVHADLTAAGLTQKMQERQESLMAYLSKAMLNSSKTQNQDFGVTDQELASVDFMAILNGTASAKDRRILRKLFASALSSSGGVLSSLGDSAIISERNKAALEVVSSEAALGKKSLALFYGAAHMPDLEKRLQRQGWKKVNTDWIKAWSI